MMNVIERMFDLQSVPRRSLLQQLADYATDKLQRDKLRELCAGENREDLYNYINRPRRTIAETLMDFAQTARAVPLFRW
jgi:sulfite reductase alpha subunit-like flavoprotein